METLDKNVMESMYPILHTIRNINKLLARENDTDIILDNLCKILVDSSRYQFVWAARFDKSKALTHFHSFGKVKSVEFLEKRLKEGSFPPNVSEAFTSKKAILNQVKDNNCPLELENPESYIITTPLISEKQVHGVLCAIMIPEITDISFDLNILSELSEDLSRIISSLYRNQDILDILFNRPEGIIILDDDLCIVDINPFMLRLIQIDNSTIVKGQGVSDFFTNHLAFDNIKQLIRLSFSTQNQSNSIEHHFKGKDLEISTSNEELYNHKLVIVKDITKIRNINREFANAQKLGKIGSWSINVENGQGYGSEQTCEIYGIPFDKPILTNDIQNIHMPEYRNFLDIKLHQLITKGEEYNVEFKLKNRKSGAILDVHSIAEFNPETKMITGIIRDITKEKQSQEEILKFKSISDQALYGTAIAKPDGTLIYVNDYFAKIHGYTKEEVIGKHILIFHSEAQSKSIESLVHSVLKEERIEAVEIQHTHKDGTEFSMLMSFVVIKDELGTPKFVSTSAFDLTEIKRSKDQVKLSELKYHTLFDSINDAALIHHFLDEGFSTFVEVNQTACQRYGYSREEMLKLTARDITSRTWAIKYGKKSNRSKLLKDQWNVFEAEHITKDGSTFPVEISSRIFNINDKPMIMSLVRDITERKKAEKELVDNEKRFRLIFENKGTATAIMNREGYIITANSRCTDLSEYTQEELLSGMKWKDLSHPEDVEPFLSKFHDSHEHNVKTDRVAEIRLITKSSKLKFVLVHYDFMPDSQEIITSLTDISALRNYEVELIEKNNQLIVQKNKAEESDRLKTAFLTNISHEIRTPMNGILGFTEILQDPDLTGEEQKEYLEIIKKSGDRMLNTINDLIDISKIEAGTETLRLKETNICELFKELFDFFKPEVEKKGLQFLLQSEALKNNITIKTDQDKLNSVLTNLIKNAIKFTNKGYIKMEFGIINNMIQFAITDTGIGIPKNRRSAIFERFIQADITESRPYEGSGLGLSISKSYIEMLDGQLWLESEVNKGSTFYFTIPYSQSIIETKQSGSTSSNPEMMKPEKTKAMKVLIFEDDQFSFSYLNHILEKEGHEIFRAENGEIGLEMYRKDPYFDLILMDIKMPKLNGIDATKLIREMDKDVIIIAQSAYTQTDDINKAIKAGCNDYVTKPINKKELLKTIDEYCS